MDERITDLEIRFIHQERTLEDLNETVCKHELVIERLERELRQVREQMKQSLPSMLLEQDEEEPPPHY